MPFSRKQASLDTNILYYFYLAGCLKHLWGLFPDGIWIDSSVLQEIRDEFGADLEKWLHEQELGFNTEKSFDDRHYVEMAEIKARCRGLKHADIITIVAAQKNGATCLSSDKPVYTVCTERGIPVARHLGCLEEAVMRGMMTKAEALATLDCFIEEGLHLPGELVANYQRLWREQ